MAGRGPAPKDPDKRARRNADPHPTRRIRFVAAKQPALPRRMPDGRAWPSRTRTWWKRWGDSPQAESFTALEWDYLLDTAVLHGELWHGDSAKAAELRLRLAKFGPTPEDQQRLRIRYDRPDPDAVADVGRSIPKGSTARERYRDLRVVPGGRATSG